MATESTVGLDDYFESEYEPVSMSKSIQVRSIEVVSARSIYLYDTTGQSFEYTYRATLVMPDEC